MSKVLGKSSECSVARALTVLNDPWTVLIVREALIAKATRFGQFRDALGIAPNILTKRLRHVVAEGLMERRTYQAPGARTRDEYVLTESGRALSIVIASLADWGRKYLARPDSHSPLFVDARTGVPARLLFADAEGTAHHPADLIAERAPDAELAR
ncbi:MAG: winged helix-turn-helix transcriptional regulator [Cumulibacter sp.]